MWAQFLLLSLWITEKSSLLSFFHINTNQRGKGCRVKKVGGGDCLVANHEGLGVLGLGGSWSVGPGDLLVISRVYSLRPVSQTGQNLYRP